MEGVLGGYPYAPSIFANVIPRIVAYIVDVWLTIEMKDMMLSVVVEAAPRWRGAQPPSAKDLSSGNLSYLAWW